jgi:hypothetical protein
VGEAVDVVTDRDEMLREMAAGKARDAGDEHAPGHGRIVLT